MHSLCPSAGHSDAAAWTHIFLRYLTKTEVVCHRGVQTFKIIKEILAAAIAAEPSPAEAKLNHARDLLAEVREQIKTHPENVFQPDVLRALILVRDSDSAEWMRFRIAARKHGVSLRYLAEALQKEEFAQYKESRQAEGNGGDTESQGPEGEGGAYAQGARSPTSKYEVKVGCIYWNKPLQDNIVPVRLSNFTAKIESEETLDDGVEERKVFIVSGSLSNGRPFQPARVPAAEFNLMVWVTKLWGASAIPSAGQGNKDHLRAAIQDLSGEIASRISYCHSGWRKIGGEWYFFFNGGAISERGLEEKFNVDLGSGKIKDYQLETPPKAEALTAAIRASLSLLNLGTPRITYPLFAAIYRAVTGEALAINFAIFLFGMTGIGKTEVAALAQAHFGKAFSGNNLPGNWTSTANSLELQASASKDVLFTIDDYSPQPHQGDATRLSQIAERLIRGQGNQAGRGRTNSDLQQRPERFSRGLILVTGEDLPRGASLRGRTLIIDVKNGDVDFGKLGPLQAYASDGLLAQATSGYVQWLAPRIDQLKVEMPKRHKEIRQMLAGCGKHKRSPDMMASLLLGMDIFLQFAVESGAIDCEVATLHRENLKVAIGELSDAQKIHQLSENPANRFIELIGGAISAGKAHVADSKTNSAPKDAEQWGWQPAGVVLEGQNTLPSETFRPRGDTVGWLPDNGELWLDGDAAFAVATRLASDQKTSLSISAQTLWKHLAEKALLITNPKEPRNQLKRMVAGKRRYVLVFANKDIIFDGVPDDSEVPSSEVPGEP